MASNAVRGGALLGGCASASVSLTLLSWPAGTRWNGLLAASPEQSLPALLCLAMAAACAWAGLLVLAGLAAQRRGAAGRLGAGVLRRLAPAAVRRGLEVVLGATTVLAVSTSAAQASSTTAVRPAAAAAAQVPASLDRPAVSTPATPEPAVRLDLDRPAVSASRGIALVSTVPTRSPVHQAESAGITVRQGDSLWRIAARSLPPGAGQHVIERAWHRWYEANRDVIGSDPNLLQPGQHLVPPQS